MGIVNVVEEEGGYFAPIILGTWLRSGCLIIGPDLDFVSADDAFEVVPDVYKSVNLPYLSSEHLRRPVLRLLSDHDILRLKWVLQMAEGKCQFP